MGKKEKQFNKWILGAVIGSAIIGITGFSMSPKGKSFWKRMRILAKKHGKKSVRVLQQLGEALAKKIQ